MLRSILIGTLALALAAGQSFAQEKKQSSPEQMQSLVGLALFSSDGQELGKITQVGMSGAQSVVRAEIGGFLNVEPSAVVIPISGVEQKSGRVELGMTAAEVKDTIDKQKR